MPIGDWQFWVVTALAMGCVYVLVRALRSRKHSRPKRVQLTITRSGTSPEDREKT